MPNPFEQLMGKKKENIETETVSGAFACQTLTCEYVVNEAKLITDEGILSWECPDSHMSKLENFFLD